MESFRKFLGYQENQIVEISSQKLIEEEFIIKTSKKRPYFEENESDLENLQTQWNEETISHSGASQRKAFKTNLKIVQKKVLQKQSCLL